jgi:undecaprenyl pyrophosphate phosphatase UppP
MSAILTYPEAIVLGAFQGVTELFPVSSLGHSVLIPALIGGSWKANLDVTASKSPYLAFIVGMHVSTAIAMIIYFWRDWLRIIKGFFSSLRQIASPAPANSVGQVNGPARGTKRFEFRDPYQKLAWMIILGTIPVGLAGVILDHPVRTVLAKPAPTAIFLTLNGVLLFGGEIMRRRRAGLDTQQAMAGQRTAAVPSAAGGWHQGTVGQGTATAQGWDPQREYRDQSRYGEVGYGDQGGYGRQAGYPSPGYDDRGSYAGRGHGPQGYGDGGDYRNQEGFGNREGYGQGGYADRAQGSGQYGSDPRYGNRGAYDQGGYDRPGYSDQRGYGEQRGYGDRQYDDRDSPNDPWGGDPRHHDQRGYDERDYRQGGPDPRDYGQGGRHRSQQYPPQQYPPQEQPPQQHQAGPSHAAGQRPARQQETDLAITSDRRLAGLSWLTAIGLGASQILALFPGFSRDGSVMVAGMGRGLSRQDAVRFSFLLSAPVIFAAGLFKANELLGPETKGIHGPILAGMLVSGICAYLALWFLDRLLSNPKRTLTPFAIYCLIAGIVSLLIVG